MIQYNNLALGLAPGTVFVPPNNEKCMQDLHACLKSVTQVTDNSPS